MRIFQILEFNQFNTGSVHQMLQAAQGLRERGHEVTVVSRPGAEMARRSSAAGVEYRSFPFRHQFDLRTIAGLRRLIRERRPDVVHVHKGTAHAVALAATIGNSVGAFVVNRGVSFPLDLWNRGKYRTDRVDLIVTVCRQIKDVIVESGKLPTEKVEVVYAGTDTTLFDPDRLNPRAFRTEKAIPDDSFLIAQVGIRDWKGWMELTDAVAELSREGRRVYLALIGAKNEGAIDEVRRYARSRGAADVVTPVEVRDDMPNVFASCDLVVDASWAGTGITGTIREAMALRKPTVSTTAGGNDELVSSPAVGWLIPMKDHAALTGAIREVMDDPSRAAEVGRNAREHVVRGFSKEIRIRRLEELYQGVLARKRM